MSAVSRHTSPAYAGLIAVVASWQLAPRRLLGLESEIGEANFVVALHQESEFAVGEMQTRLRPGVDADPLSAHHHLVHDMIRGDVDLNGKGFLLVQVLQRRLGTLIGLALHHHLRDRKSTRL